MLTARDESRGQKAAQDLRREEGIADDAVVYKQLDIGDPASVEVSIDVSSYISSYQHQFAVQLEYSPNVAVQL